jgi:glycosyltransferase involved in cell wall biosynthesis
MKKRIVYIVGDLSYPNGMSRVLSQKVNYLAEHTDYEMYVVLTENASMPHYYELSQKVQYINFDINFEVIQTMPLYRKVWYYYRKTRQYKRQLTNYLMEVQPDITVSVLRREINFINDIQDGSKKIGEIHFNRQSYRVFNKSFLPQFVNRFITNRWKKSLDKQVRRLDHFVVLTNEDARNWVGFNNLSVIPNPISKFPSVMSDCMNKHAIAVGRYTWQKGFDMLISAWKSVYERHPDWVLDIYGAGNPTAFREQAERDGISSVVCCHEADSDIYGRYAESSLFVLSSRYEGFGLVIIEAMATGLPVVSFRCPCGPEDIISDGEDGILVENGNIEKLADAICYLIENADKRKQYGLKGNNKSRRYQEDGIMQKWIELFNNC